MNKQVSILGCGWLGFPLAKACLEKDYLVKGATTSIEKLSFFSSEGIVPYHILLTTEGIEGNVHAFLEASKVLIINIPPKRKSGSEGGYLRELKFLIPQIETSAVEKVVFVSSTSVYKDSAAIQIYSETATNEPELIGNTELLEAENLFFKNEKFSSTIVRFGGLIGEDRHPIHFLAGKKGIKYPKAPVNLISQPDCIEILLQIEEKEAWGRVFNAVYPFHPSKEDYYTQKASELSLKQPIFDFEKPTEGKIISSEYIMKQLNFNFRSVI